MRPILISMIPHKIICSAIGLRAKEDLQPVLQDLQYGIGTSQGPSASWLTPRPMLKGQGGVLPAGRCQRVLYAAPRPDSHSHSGAACRRTRLATHHRLIEHFLACPSTVFHPGLMDEELQPLSLISADGLPQGDPLSALMFSSAIAALLRRAIKSA